MIPIFVWNRKQNKWEIFPTDLLTTFSDGLTGLEPCNTIAEQRLLDSYPYLFAKQLYGPFSISSPYRYIFLPPLPRIQRFKFQARQAFDQFMIQSFGVLAFLLALIGIAGTVLVFMLGIYTIVRYFIS